SCLSELGAGGPSEWNNRKRSGDYAAEAAFGHGGEMLGENSCVSEIGNEVGAAYLQEPAIGRFLSVDRGNLCDVEGYGGAKLGIENPDGFPADEQLHG